MKWGHINQQVIRGAINPTEQNRAPGADRIFFFSFVKWKLQSPQQRWQYIVGSPGYHRAHGLRECGLARFPFWVALEGAGLQQLFCCLTASTARVLLSMANGEFRIQVMVEAVVACPEPEHYHLFPSGWQVVGVSLVVLWVLMPPLPVLFGLEDGLHLRVCRQNDCKHVEGRPHNKCKGSGRTIQQSMRRGEDPWNMKEGHHY